MSPKKGSRRELDSLLESAWQAQQKRKTWLQNNPMVEVSQAKARWFHLRSWMDRSSSPKEVSSNRRGAETILAIVLAVVPSALDFAVIWKWSAWGICLFLLVWFVLPDWVPVLGRFPLKTRALALVLVMLISVGGFHGVWRSQRMEEKSKVLTGELCSLRSHGVCYTPPVAVIEVGGASGSEFVYTGDENDAHFGTFARDVGLRIERGDHGMQISTPVLDRSGRKIADIERNRWTVVPQPGIWDKNYTDNALEIEDSRGEVVLQLKYLPDRLQIAVEWRDQFGRGQEWAKCVGPDKRMTGCIIPWGSPQTELQNEVPIEPMFLYPSKEYLGQFVNKGN